MRLTSRLLKSMEGVFALDKPAGISSAQAIRTLQSHFSPSSHFAPLLTAQADAQAAAHKNDKYHKKGRAARRSLQVKMGHGGTLDPAAMGVLILGVGSGTKALPRFLSCSKTYECVVLFGAATDSYDGEGKVVRRRPYGHVRREDVERVLREKFSGVFMQRPPIFSALNVDGKRAYEYAREGKELPRELAEREVDVSEIACVEWLEGGSHEYRWPENGAPVKEKKVPKKLAGVQKSSSPSTKRKRELVEDDETVTALPSTKQARLSPSQLSTETKAIEGVSHEDAAASAESEPTMSGALSTSQPLSSSVTDDITGPPAARIRLTSSRGFYVRSLCHDLGLELSSYGLMAHLIRVRQGDFALRGELEKTATDTKAGAVENVEVDARDEGGEADVKKPRGQEAKKDEKGKPVNTSQGIARWDVLEYEELEKGEAVWAPRVKRMLDRWTRAENAAR